MANALTIEGPVGLRTTILTNQGEIEAIAEPVGGGGLPATGDVIPDPLDATKNFITKLQRFNVVSTNYDNDHLNFVLAWTPNVPSTPHWTLIDPLLQTPRIVTAGAPFVASVTDHTIVVNQADTPVTIALPDPGSTFLQSGKQIIIVDGNGTATGQPITIAGTGANVNGAPSVTIASDRGAKTVTWVNGVVGWLVTSQVGT